MKITQLQNGQNIYSHFTKEGIEMGKKKAHE